MLPGFMSRCAAILLVAACAAKQGPDGRLAYWGKFDYPTAPVETTAKGIRYDPSGLPISGALIDRLTDEVEACLERPVDRASFVVKVAADSSLSCSKDQEVLPVVAGSMCKGMAGTPDCPCKWRAAVLLPNILVTTPSMYLLKDAMVRFLTRSRDPWSDPALVLCVAPTTDPLGDGSR